MIFGRNRLRRLKLSFLKFLGAIVVVIVLVVCIVGSGPARRASPPEAGDAYDIRPVVTVPRSSLTTLADGNKLLVLDAFSTMRPWTKSNGVP